MKCFLNDLVYKNSFKNLSEFFLIKIYAIRLYEYFYLSIKCISLEVLVVGDIKNCIVFLKKS